VVEDGVRFTLVAGNTRYLALRFLGWTYAPCRIYPEGTPHLEALRLAENLQRCQLSIIEEALQVRTMTQGDPKNIDAVAATINRSPAWVLARLSALSWPADVQEAVHHGDLSASSAKWLARVTDDAHRARLLHWATHNGCTASTARLWYQDWLSAASPSTENEPPQTEHSPNAYVLDTRVTCATCQTLTPLQETMSLRVCPDCVKQITNAAPGQKNDLPT
jgi:ParB/RepB/Spo0J family partition protein